MNKDMQVKWENLHSKSRFRPKYPSEEVVQFIFRNFDMNLENKVLDLGCGAGRHVYLLAKEGINAYGCDISKEGIDYTRQLLKENNLIANLDVATMEKLPYDDNFFDGIICCGVLYYSKIKEIKKSVLEMYRVLKKGGKALVIVRNINDYRFNGGEEVEKNTFIINESDSKKCSFNENGMLMHFFSKEEVLELFNVFEEVSIDEIIHTHNNGNFKDSNYIINLKK